MTRFNDVLGWGDSVDITGLPDNVDVVFAGGAAPYIMHGWVNDNPFWFTYRNGGAWLQVGEEGAELPAGIDNNRVLWEAFATSDILDPSEWIKNSDYASFISEMFGNLNKARFPWEFRFKRRVNGRYETHTATEWTGSYEEALNSVRTMLDQDKYTHTIVNPVPLNWDTRIYP